jgi:hypothetical protein
LIVDNTTNRKEHKEFRKKRKRINPPFLEKGAGRLEKPLCSWRLSWRTWCLKYKNHEEHEG